MTCARRNRGRTKDLGYIMQLSKWPRIRTLTLADQVYHAVRARIMDRSLRPGEFVREHEVSRALGVSRTPVREALGRLATEGFLERIPHHGFRVPANSLADLLELYPIVSSLELTAARLALPRLTPQDIERLKAITTKLREARDRNDIEAISACKAEFHDTICQKSGNRRLVDMLRDLRSQIMRLEVWYYTTRENASRSIECQEEIVRHIERGEFEKAIETLRSNIFLTYDELSAQYAREEGLRNSA